jgi:hypothetical protein
MTVAEASTDYGVVACGFRKSDQWCIAAVNASLGCKTTNGTGGLNQVTSDEELEIGVGVATKMVREVSPLIAGSPCD